MEDVVEILMFRSRKAGVQPGGELGKGFANRHLFKADQDIGKQQQAHLGAHQMGGIMGKTQAVQHHQQGIPKAIHPGALGCLQKGRQQGLGHIQHRQKAANPLGIRQTADPQPNRQPLLAQALQILGMIEAHQPGPIGLEHHG